MVFAMQDLMQKKGLFNQDPGTLHMSQPEKRGKDNSEVVLHEGSSSETTIYHNAIE